MSLHLESLHSIVDRAESALADSLENPQNRVDLAQSIADLIDAKVELALEKERIRALSEKD